MSAAAIARNIALQRRQTPSGQLTRPPTQTAIDKARFRAGDKKLRLKLRSQGQPQNILTPQDLAGGNVNLSSLNKREDQGVVAGSGARGGARVNKDGSITRQSGGMGILNLPLPPSVIGTELQELISSNRFENPF